MAGWGVAYWDPTVADAMGRRDRRGGAYRRYIPDRLATHPFTLDTDLSHASAHAERTIRALNGPQAESLAAVARFLLRSEAIASSRIEGITPSAQQVALAELGHHESVRGVSAQAKLVANNMTVVRAATEALATADEVTVADIESMHQALLPDEPRHHGLRRVQNWIGGSNWHPLDAAFVPPAPEQVRDLMQDLVDYLNGAAHGPLVQAAVVHAQFETIHPFTDGNGRVGRALIHTVLTRRGLTSRAVLPISLVLATLSQQYVAGLTAFRYDGPAASSEAVAGVRTWLSVLVSAAEVACQQSVSLVEQISDLQRSWSERVADHRAATGVREVPRADSTTARLLGLLPEAPVATAGTLQRILGVSHPAASNALDELFRAGILRTTSVDRGATAYIATEILDLITHTERALASTRFDTRLSEPGRSVPARPVRD